MITSRFGVDWRRSVEEGRPVECRPVESPIRARDATAPELRGLIFFAAAGWGTLLVGVAATLLQLRREAAAG